MRFIKTICIFSVAIWCCGDLMAQQEGKDKKERTRQTRRDGKSRGNFVEMLKKLDKNGDSVISRDEIPERMAARFDRMDLDGSGAIEASEVKAIAKRLRDSGKGKQAGKRRGKKRDMQDDKGNRKKGKKGKGQKRKGNKKTDKAGDQDSDAPRGRRGGAMSIERMLKSFDKNNDQKISKEEAPERLNRVFGRLDKNSDGVLDMKELKALQKMIAERGGAKGDKKKKRDSKRGGEGQSRPGVKPKRPGGDA